MSALVALIAVAKAAVDEVQDDTCVMGFLCLRDGRVDVQGSGQDRVRLAGDRVLQSGDIAFCISLFGRAVMEYSILTPSCAS